VSGFRVGYMKIGNVNDLEKGFEIIHEVLFGGNVLMSDL